MQDGRSVAGTLLPIDCIQRAQARHLKDGAIWVDRAGRPAVCGSSDKDEGFGEASKAGGLNYMHTVESIRRQRREWSITERAAIERVSNERPDGIVRFPMPEKAGQNGKADGEEHEEKRMDRSAGCWLSRASGLCAGSHLPLWPALRFGLDAGLDAPVPSEVVTRVQRRRLLQ